MQKKTKVFVSSIIIIIAISVIANYTIFMPTPIVKDVGKYHIIMIRYYENGGSQVTHVKDYNQEEILKYLNTCMERRTLESSGGYMLGDVTIEIILHTEEGTKQILLGNINYSSFGRGTPKYKILHTDEVKVEILKILNLD